MPKKSKKTSSRKSFSQGNKQKVAAKTSFFWKKWIKKGLISFAFLVLIGATATVYSKMQKETYDLSVIGNGTATVVQIHDPNCQLCQRLKNNLDSVKGEFKGEIQFKTANITNTKGRSFANRHRVSHVTLLLFNKKGHRVNTLEGVTPKEDIREALKRLKKDPS